MHPDKTIVLLEDLSHFLIESIDRYLISGRFNHLKSVVSSGGEYGPGWLYNAAGEGQSLAAIFDDDLDRSTGKAILALPELPEDHPLVPGMSLPYFGATYDALHVDMALNPEWEEKVYHAAETQDGWPHQNCFYCLARINEGSPGYRHPSSYWACKICYDKFLHDQSLSFLILS